MKPTIEKITEPLRLGEGPHWDVGSQCLYFAGMIENNIHKYDPKSKVHTCANVGENVSFIIPVKNTEDKFLISMDRTLAIITWDGKSDKVEKIRKIAEVDEGTAHVFIDGKCDPIGRIWAGTMGCSATSLEIPDGKGTLYSYYKGEIKAHRSDIGIANGLAFDTKLKRMYYIDSYRHTVDQYDYDVTSGTISNLKQFFTGSKHGLGDFLFDGMTIDADGNLWIAVFNGSRVIKIDPRRPETLLYTIEMPATQITSVAFGGENLDELYVTSAAFNKERGPSEGCTFRVTGLNTKGMPADDFVE